MELFLLLLTKLIINCCSTNPNKRLSFKDILNRIGSENFIRSIELLDLEVFKEYQKKADELQLFIDIKISNLLKKKVYYLKSGFNIYQIIPKPIEYTITFGRMRRNCGTINGRYSY